MYPIVASDLDGTLLSPEHSLTDFAAQTLQRVTQRGVSFVFATGRHHVDVAQIREKLGIDAYMITSNGARVHDTQGNLLFAHNLDRDIAEELILLKYQDKEILTQIYRDDEWFIARECHDDSSFFMESDFRYQIYQPVDFSLEGISKVFFTCNDHQQLLQLEAALVARFGDRVNVSFSLPICLEVMAGGVSKGHALDKVSRRLGYSLQDCIAFGDGMNDKEMLSMAGKGCIMENGQQRLKELLPDLAVIGNNGQDAVPRYLRQLYAVTD
ncbi:sugar/pyridoxal phosphate phosphatase YigL [Rosenbergiella australiborealis]|uniref:sugar/pyridoxal phosphate phosphatase YigL n=1 Tax=Rosenbergiella australiborealis TaxID=1544696 RepID=UPI001F4D7D5B|nr:sugar/pyridoxal phosphate phosphatase YigL [Rosenbergiella australiborealis]